VRLDREEKRRADELVKKIMGDIDAHNKTTVSGKELWEIIKTEYKIIKLLEEEIEDLKKRIEKLEEQREIGILIRK
jgi:uncharacterized protein YceH (UPF0502 family)